jgi:DHA2 family multidrug resistance protein-like MFS transporter
VRRGSSQPGDALAQGDTKARASVTESAPSTAPRAAARGTDDASTVPERAGLVLTALIVVAGVANLNLSVANVALPDIGKHFDSSQTTLDLIAVGYSLGLACSVLWLGALGDRYGR